MRYKDLKSGDLFVDMTPGGMLCNLVLRVKPTADIVNPMTTPRQLLDKHSSSLEVWKLEILMLDHDATTSVTFKEDQEINSSVHSWRVLRRGHVIARCDFEAAA